MDLSRLEITLRPRSHWEAIDLGFALARRWFRPLCLLWLASAIPALVLSGLVTGGSFVWMSVLVWWFKPAYEPPLMFWLSRAVFGEQVRPGSLRQHWWHIVRPQLFANLTWRRLSSNRSFYMPVPLLEGLKGKERKQRLAILGRRQQAGTWLTVVGIHFEAILEISLMLVVYFLVPEELRWFEGGELFFSPGPIDEWLQLACWLASMAIIAPFYVAGGFALYLHRRSQLEGWDIEINFRSIAEKLSTSRRSRAGVLASALLCLAVLMQTPQEAFAADKPGPQESKQLIEGVLADPHFGRLEQQGYWKYVGEQNNMELPDGFGKVFEMLLDILKGFLQGIADVGEILLWSLGLFVLAYLLYHFSRNADWMQLRGRGGGTGRRRLPTELFGLDVRPDSLPEDITAEALRMLNAGELRGALSLLYRATLVRLITEHQLEIPDSATEGECLRLVQRHRSHGEADYFRALTRVWLVTAYAHLPPEAARIEQLCHGWQQVYGHA